MSSKIMITELILDNLEFFKMIYALIIIFICSVIFLKTDRMFKLSDHQGIRYFRNAFFFYGLAFIVKFILGGAYSNFGSFEYFYLNFIKIFFEFFIIVAGLCLLNSLSWKYVKRRIFYSLINLQMILFYFIAAGIAILDIILYSEKFLYFSQIILFLIMAVLSYKNYFKNGKNYKFSIYSFVAIIVGLIYWILMSLMGSQIFIGSKTTPFVHGINFLFFFIFLYAIKKITNKKNGKEKK